MARTDGLSGYAAAYKDAWDLHQYSPNRDAVAHQTANATGS